MPSWNREIRGLPQSYVSYRSQDKIENIDICVCSRFFTRGAKTKLERNWEIEACRETVDLLLEDGYKVCSVGLRTSARHIGGTTDYMDIDLDRLSMVLSSAKLIVGPSSGVMHFATLCNCPQVTWGESHLKKRYLHEWNPFFTKVEYLVKNKWNPTAAEVFDTIKRMDV